MTTLPVTLDRTSTEAWGTQLAGSVRALLVAGTLPPGERLPSSRALAADLGVSRSVTEQAYTQLIAEGWLETRRGSGTYVAPTSPLADHRTSPTRRTPPVARAHRGDRGAGVVRRAADAAADVAPVRLDTGTPWIDPRHRAGWRRAWREVSTATPPRGYDDPRGLPELRRVLAERLGRVRGVRCDPDEVLVTGGTTDGLRHLLAALRPGPVGFEDPGYRAAVETARVMGRDIVDLPATEPPTDLEGLAAVYVTPAHQHPLGRVMPAADRRGLLEAATRAGTVVIEDDYDSEFRYDVAPIPALTALDRDRVAYLGTAAKAVAPSLRLGWLVPPPDLRESIDARRALTHDAAPWPVQRAFLSLVRDGYLDQVVRSARRVYARRAPRVAEALAPYADQVGPSAGMYSTWLLPQSRAVHARDAARAAGFEVNLLADYCRSADLTGLVVGFGGVSDGELEAALAALTAALRDGP